MWQHRRTATGNAKRQGGRGGRVRGGYGYGDAAGELLVSAAYAEAGAAALATLNQLALTKSIRRAMTSRANHRWSVAAMVVGAALCGCSSLGAFKKQNNAATASAAAQCKNEFATPELDPIRHKVELYRESTDAGVPFEIASNDTFPTDAELPVIARWAMLRDECIRQIVQLSTTPAHANAMQSAFIRQRQSLYNQAGERISELIVALHQKKLTYGEFAHKRYEINRAVWISATAVGDISFVLPSPIAKLFDLDSSPNPVLF